MKYLVLLNLSERGKAIVGADTRTITIEISNKSNIDTIDYQVIEQEILKIFTRDLYENYTVSQSFEAYGPETVVIIHDPDPDAEHPILYGQIRHKINDGYGKEFYIQTIDEYGNINFKDYRFNFWGNEIGGSRKYKRYITIANTDEVETYNNRVNANTLRLNLYNKLIDKYNNQVRTDLTVDDTLKLLKLLESYIDLYKIDSEYSDDKEYPDDEY